MSDEILTYVLDAGGLGRTRVRDVVQAFTNHSQAVDFIRPKKVVCIRTAEEIEHMSKRWPGWTARPWIIAGRVSSPDITTVYDGPFINDCRGDGFDQQVQNLLAAYDWALFSYFTTYQDEYWIFIATCEAESLVQFLPALGQGLLSSRRARPPLMEKLPNATYYDYGEEGWLPYELARERGEGSPLIVSQIDGEFIDRYRNLTDKLQEVEQDVWFRAALDKLECLKEVEVSEDSWHRGLFLIHRAIDFDAYPALWSKTSSNWGIATAVFSCDCDVDLLVNLLSTRYNVDIIRDTEPIATWAYGVVYGGGADEHHAIFHSRDPRITHALWECTEKSAISRF